MCHSKEKEIEAKQQETSITTNSTNTSHFVIYFVLHRFRLIPELKIIIFKNSECHLTKVELISKKLIESVWSVWFNEHITQEAEILE